MKVVKPIRFHLAYKAVMSIRFFLTKENFSQIPSHAFQGKEQYIVENNVDEQKVTTLEALEDFLRGKGFSGGKFKVCLGKPANHSVMLVKFLGTFFGLQDAERLHKYFVDNKHGIEDFEQLTSSSRKGKSSSNNDVEAMQGRNVEGLVLYGYIGISEDLDKVDMDTKRKCLIKSKKEIQDLANAIVKPEWGSL